MTHPLDNAIARSNIIMFDLKDSTITNTDILSYAAQAAAGLISTNPRTRKDNLRQLASVTCDWLFCLGIDYPWQTMRDFYDELAANNCLTHDNPAHTDQGRYLQVVEAVGNIATTLRIHNAKEDTIREITKLGSRALAWLTHELEKEQK